MSRRALYFITAALLVLALAALAGCGGSETTTTAAPPATGGETATTGGATETTSPPATTGEAITLKYAFFAPATTFPAKQMEWWKTEIEKRTNGQVKVETFPGGTLLTAKNMYDGVLQGVADIGLSCPTYEPGRFPLMSLNDLPGLYPNARVAGMSFFDAVQQFEPAEAKEFHVVTAFATEPAYITTVDPVKTLEDLNGMKVRFAGGPKYLEALGAASVGMPMSELGQALQTGVVDGYASSREVLLDYKFAEKTKNVTDYKLGAISFLAVMSADRWSKLPDNVKQVIDELAAEAALFAGDYLDTHVQESMDFAKGQGVQTLTLDDAEKARWDEKLKPLEQSTVDAVAGKGLPATDFLKALKDGATKYAAEYK